MDHEFVEGRLQLHRTPDEITSVVQRLRPIKGQLFGRGAKRIFGHSLASMFIVMIAMGLATILSGALVFALPRLGSAVVPVVEAL